MRHSHFRFLNVGFAATIVIAACHSDTTAPVTPGTIQIIVESVGSDPDDRFDVIIGNRVVNVSANGQVLIDAEPGLQSLKLYSLKSYCVPLSSSVVSVNVESGKTTKAEFHISCEGTGVRIVLSTLGTDTPDAYLVTVKPSLQSPYRLNRSDSITLKTLTPGTYQVSVSHRVDGFGVGPIDQSQNCKVQGDGSVEVTVTPVHVTRVEFLVVCDEVRRLAGIAFTQDTVIGNAVFPSIRMVSEDGTTLPTRVIGSSPAWSRDGKLLLFAGTECDSYSVFYYRVCSVPIITVNPETGSTLFVLVSGVRPDDLAWSPVEDNIAFTDSALHAIYTFYRSPSGMSLGLPTKIVLPDSPSVNSPSWSPDGQRIALTCRFGQLDEICIIKRDGTGLVRVGSSDGSGYSEPAWSKDSSVIAFVKTPGAGAVPQIALITVDDRVITILTDGTSPSWSPSGTRIVFARVDGLFTMNRDGSAISRLTTGKHQAPAWRR